VAPLQAQVQRLVESVEGLRAAHAAELAALEAAAAQAAAAAAADSQAALDRLSAGGAELQRKLRGERDRAEGLEQDVRKLQVCVWVVVVVVVVCVCVFVVCVYTLQVCVCVCVCVCKSVGVGMCGWVLVVVLAVGGLWRGNACLWAQPPKKHRQGYIVSEACFSARKHTGLGRQRRGGGPRLFMCRCSVPLLSALCFSVRCAAGRAGEAHAARGLPDRGAAAGGEDAQGAHTVGGWRPGGGGGGGACWGLGPGGGWGPGVGANKPAIHPSSDPRINTHTLAAF
jgi:uncharacterized membrane protein YgcG